MEDLFSDLSSISDCDDDCLLNSSTQKCRSFFIQSTIPEIVLDIPPAYEIEVVDAKKQKTLEEKNCETDSRGDQKFDKWVQTDQIEMESIDCSADLPPTTREATYSESALERVLRHISAHLHRSQLQQWLAEQPLRNASFHMKPVQTPTIYRAVYNEERNTFVLLLHLSGTNRRFIELRSLKNLLKSVKHEITNNCFEENDKIRIFSNHHFIVLFSSSKIKVLEIDDLDKFVIYTFNNSEEIVSVLMLNGNLCFMNSTGLISKVEGEKILECSPLLTPVLRSFVIQQKIYVVSSKFISCFSQDSPLDYESYEADKNITSGDVKRFGDHRLMLFDKSSQTCFIWETDKPKSTSHQLCFGSSEFTVDVACDDENLYSLTSSGVVSVWKLRPNGRKYRDRLFTTYLSHCTKLLLVFPQKFSILTTSQVHFVVFGADSDTSQQQ